MTGLLDRMRDATQRGLTEAAGRLEGLLTERSGEATAAEPRVGAVFAEGRFADEAGSRPYKLFVPGGGGRPTALVVMLHGCTQSPDDFAAATRMNALAERDGFLVLYPAQTSAANFQRCWNWFNEADQHRDAGEPAIVAGMTRAVVAEHGVDPRRVFVAGLSAGGALAAILGEAYPDLYAAIGVHSGLPTGAASGVGSAMTAMRRGHAGHPLAAVATPAIVFHGTKDLTVNPLNADAIAAQASAFAPLIATVQTGERGGRAFTRTIHADPSGRPLIEQWSVDGLGHAWSGGDPAGSYADPAGPDASAEMLRFFMEQRPA